MPVDLIKTLGRWKSQVAGMAQVSSEVLQFYEGGLGGDCVLGLGWGHKRPHTLTPRVWGQGEPGNVRGAPGNPGLGDLGGRTGVVGQPSYPSHNAMVHANVPRCEEELEVGLTGDARLTSFQTVCSR